MRIEQVESRLEQDPAELQNLVPPGYRIRVTLVDKNGREKSKGAHVDDWSPEVDEIRISFEPYTELEQASDIQAVDEKSISVDDFEPVSIRGESLSETVLQARR